MGDLDSLLQDFSYLKSLEYKNKAPRKASKKLLLPDPSVRYAVEYHFEKTGEAVFDRIFYRPLGHRCFQEFLFSDEYAKKDPTAKLAMELSTRIKNLMSDTYDKSYECAMNMLESVKSDIAKSLWTDAELVSKVEHKIERLKVKMEDPGHVKAKLINIKDLFAAFTPLCLEYLSQQPWIDFRSSRFWVRYTQWKHLEMNMKISPSDFDVHRILGRGGFGEVFGCRKRDTGMMFAMKKLDKRRLKLKHQETSAVHERNVLAEMSSKFVTNLKYAFHDKDTLYLILDLMEGGDLNWHLKKRSKFTEWQAKFYTAQIIMGLAHIHSRKMIYRDLKPANILLDGEGHARISDLGLVRDASHSLPTSECGTHGYMAPEVLTPDKSYDYGADWWSLGCVIYQFLVGHAPFKRSGKHKKTSKEELDDNTLNKEIVYPHDMDDDAKDLIQQLLDRDPTTRLGCRGKGASEIRSHPWFNDIDWQGLVDHKIPPAIRPERGQVNARDVYDIDRFSVNDTKAVQISAEENAKYYKHFDHIMSHQWQEEILIVYPQITSTCDSSENKRRQKIRKQSESEAPSRESEIIMQGYVLKKKSGLLSGGWGRVYLYLYADGLDLCSEQLRTPKQSYKLKDIDNLLEETTKQGNKIIHINFKSEAMTKPLDLRTEYESDHECWVENLKAQWSGVGTAAEPMMDMTPRSDSKHGMEDILDLADGPASPGPPSFQRLSSLADETDKETARVVEDEDSD